MTKRVLTVAAAALLSLSLLASGVVAAEMAGVMMKDGKEMHMKDGQMMMMSGKMMEGSKAMEMGK